MTDEYRITDEFFAGNQHIIVLNRDFDSFGKTAIIDGGKYRHTINFVRKWLIINSTKTLKEKTVSFE